MTQTLKLNGQNVYLTPTGLKVTARGRVQAPGKFLGNLGKGQARKMRKALRAAGKVNWAGAKREAA